MSWLIIRLQGTVGWSSCPVGPPSINSAGLIQEDHLHVIFPRVFSLFDNVCKIHLKKLHLIRAKTLDFSVNTALEILKLKSRKTEHTQTLVIANRHLD